MNIPIRLIVVDDHPHIHELIGLALQAEADIVTVGHAKNGAEALLLCQQLVPDLALMDVVMPQMNGVEATRQLQQLFPQLKILVMSSFQDEESVRIMLEVGAVGYILKTAIAKDLASMIRSVYHGGVVLSQEVTQHLLVGRSVGPPLTDFRLTEREHEILALVVQGMNNPEIAQALVISPSTVKFHLTNILQKMGVDSRMDAIVLALKHHLV